MPKVLDKIKDLVLAEKERINFDIEIDGGINLITLN